MINIKFIVAVLLYILSILVSFLDATDFSLLLLIISSLIQLYYVKKSAGNYSNVIFIASFFCMIYGLSGPIVSLWGNGLPIIFSGEINYPAWVLAYSLSQIGFLIGTNIVFSKKTKKRISILIPSKKIVDCIGACSVITMFLGVLFQIINIIRMGGFELLFAGKAVFQSLESSLVFTLPSFELILLSVTCLSMYCVFSKKYYNIKNKILILNLIVFLPYFIMLLLLGQRGKLLNIMMVIFLGLYFFNPLKNIKLKTLFLIILAYIAFVFVYVNRGIVPLIRDDPSLFASKVSDITRYIDNLNPGDNEFGCAFGNFNTFISNSDDYRYGETYLRGLALLVPSFIYPGEKPIQITYEFRNKYFPSEAERSSIAGTGFSSILEAYWNFGYIGILIIYILFGIILTRSENRKISSRDILHGILFIYLSTVIISFSRVQLGDVISSLFYRSIYFIIFVFVPCAIIKSKEKTASCSEK